MALSLNKVFVGGNLTREPEARQFNSGGVVCSFGIAINSKRRTGNGYEDKVTFIDVECWNQTAEFVRDYMHKGNAVLIEARLEMDQWDDKTTGQKRSKLKIVADRVQSVGPRQDQAQGNAGQYEQQYQQPQPAQRQAASSSPMPPPPPFPVDVPAPGGDVFDVSDADLKEIPF